ncbi:MAG: urease accessory protein [Nitrospiraceae bacterium]
MEKVLVDTSLTAALGLGFLLGLRHALDADHVAAMSALVSRHHSLTLSCVLGTCWGAGHTVALLTAGVAIITFQLTISPEMAWVFEMAVAVVLIFLGADVLLRSVGPLTLHRHAHAHESHAHSHLHTHTGVQDGPGHTHLLTVGRRPFLVGLLHGMAGSAALMLLVLTTIPSLVGKFLYLLVFGIGSTMAMLLLSGLLGIPFAASAPRSETTQVVLQALAGGASLVVGVVLVWTLGHSYQVR